MQNSICWIGQGIRLAGIVQRQQGQQAEEVAAQTQPKHVGVTLV